MPRAARLKSLNNMYHTMFRSLSEFDLFRDDDDKVKYLELLKKYQYKYGFAVYSYCLMDNHGHLLIDCLGADISKIMHVINFCYAQYYNKKYKRAGPVFRDRFNSKPIDTEKYFVTLTGYIHNNPKDIHGYRDNVVAYPFSSLKEYFDDTNTYGILNTKFLKELLHFSQGENKTKYLELVGMSESEEFEHDFEFVNPKTDYRSERCILLKDTEPEKIIAYVAKYLNQDPLGIHIRYDKSYTKLRALNCFLMSCFCNIKQREICEIIGNITQSRVSKLSLMGLEFILKDKRLLEECLIA
ncbi:MAG TPA: transposase [Epulopiscium sp.]|nr:transposase [Candidatus Epulonipiscium sp.]